MMDLLARGSSYIRMATDSTSWPSLTLVASSWDSKVPDSSTMQDLDTHQPTSAGVQYSLIHTTGLTTCLFHTPPCGIWEGLNCSSPHLDSPHGDQWPSWFYSWQYTWSRLVSKHQWLLNHLMNLFIHLQMKIASQSCDYFIYTDKKNVSLKYLHHCCDILISAHSSSSGWSCTL